MVSSPLIDLQNALDKTECILDPKLNMTFILKLYNIIETIKFYRHGFEPPKTTNDTTLETSFQWSQLHNIKSSRQLFIA